MKIARLIMTLAFLAAFVVLLPLGCSSDDDGGGGGSQSLTASTYIPFTVGAHWEYEDSSSTGIDTSTTDIIGTAEMMGYESYIFVDADGENDTFYMQNRSDGIYQIILPSLGGFLRGMNTTQFEDTMVMKLMPATFNIGDSWTMYNMDTTYEETIYKYIMSMEILGQAQGVESVTVPAGTFGNCLKLLSNWSMSMVVVSLSDSTDTLYSSNDESENTMWFAPNMGLIKSSSNDADSLFTSVLISYTGVAK